jgi:hypothetical protein
VRLEVTFTPQDFDEWAKSPKPHKKRDWRPSLFGWVVFIALAIVLVIKIQHSSSPATAPAPRPDNVWNILTLIWPWVLIFGFLWFYVFRQMRNQGLYLWKQNEELQQPHVFTIDAAGIEVAAMNAATRFMWAAFAGWMETANLFIVWQANGQYTLIPKRAATEGQRAELRDWFRQHIAVPTGGFPVLPAMGAKTEDPSH